MKNFKDLLNLVKERPKKTIAVASCDDKEVLEAVQDACKLDIANFYLFGNVERAKEIIKVNNLSIPDDVKFVDVADPVVAAMEAVKCVSSNQADVLMKGLVDTKVILKEVLNKEYGLRSDSILSHVVIFEIPKLKRLIFLTDAAMNIAPSKTDLLAIINNSVKLAKSLNFDKPKVALISAVEKVNEKMPSTVLEAEIVNELKGNVDYYIDGPVALDIALDKHAALTKNITGDIKGDADIIVVPFIEVGNALYKGWVFGCEGVKNAGIVVGARKPIILTSRADSHEAKLYSIILGLLL